MKNCQYKNKFQSSHSSFQYKTNTNKHIIFYSSVPRTECTRRSVQFVSVRDCTTRLVCRSYEWESTDGQVGLNVATLYTRQFFNGRAGVATVCRDPCIDANSVASSASRPQLCSPHHTHTSNTAVPLRKLHTHTHTQ